MTCCYDDFETLISTTDGQQRIKAEYTAVFSRPPVGHCENSLRDMYLFLRAKHEQQNLNMTQKLKVKAGCEIQHIAGSVTDLSKWSQKEIRDYLVLFPKATFFEPVEEVEKTKK